MMIKRGRAAVRIAALIAAAALAGALLGGCGAEDNTGDSAAEETIASEKETGKQEAETGAEDGSSKGDETSEATDAAKAPEASEGTETSEDLTLYPFVEKEYLSDYDDISGKLLAQTEYCRVGIHDDEEQYTELNAALSAYNEEKRAAAAEEQAFLLETARAAAEETEDFYGYQSSSEVKILRADERVFSFAKSVYSFTGGAHGNSGVIGVSFDSKTGEELRLSNVISDKEALSAYITARLEEEYGSMDMLFEDWKEYVGSAADFNFALGPSGMEVYFDPYEIGPYALGEVTIEVPYTEESIGFNEAFLPAKEQSMWELEAYDELMLDVDGDNEAEAIGLSFQAQEDQSQSTYTFYVMDGEETSSVNGICGYGMDKAYILKKPEGGYVFYGDCKSDNDWHYLTMVDIDTLMAGDGADPTEYYEAFYDNVPVSAESFYLETRGSLISTVPERRRHCVAGNGLPEALQDDFIIDGLILTAKKDIKCISESGKGEESTIPAGTELRAVSTDESSYIIAELTASGEAVRIEVNGESWPHTIDGTDIEDCFEGLVFAG